MKILLVGEPMGLLIANELGNLENVNTFTRKIAGAELNVAVGLSRLGYNVEYSTKIGNDLFGKTINKFLIKENIGTSYLKIDEKKSTGFMFKSKVENGDPYVEYFRKNSAFSTISIEDIKKIKIDDFDLIHVTGITLAISLSAREAIIYLINEAKNKNKIVTFDPNLRLQMWENKEEMATIINELSTKVDLFLPGINEARILLKKDNLEEIISEYRKMGVKNIIIKDGSKGSHYITESDHVFVNSYKVDKVIDTVGAGDGFAVGILSAYLEKLSKEEILKRGNAIGSIQVQHISDNEGLPTRNELLKYIESRDKY